MLSRLLRQVHLLLCGSAALRLSRSQLLTHSPAPIRLICSAEMLLGSLFGNGISHWLPYCSTLDDPQGLVSAIAFRAGSSPTGWSLQSLELFLRQGFLNKCGGSGCTFSLTLYYAEGFTGRALDGRTPGPAVCCSFLRRLTSGCLSSRLFHAVPYAPVEGYARQSFPGEEARSLACQGAHVGMGRLLARIINLPWTHVHPQAQRSI